jgi:hypothetical protein
MEEDGSDNQILRGLREDLSGHRRHEVEVLGKGRCKIGRAGHNHLRSRRAIWLGHQFSNDNLLCCRIARSKLSRIKHET